MLVDSISDQLPGLLVKIPFSGVQKLCTRLGVESIKFVRAWSISDAYKAGTRQVITNNTLEKYNFKGPSLSVIYIQYFMSIQQNNILLEVF